MSRTLVNLLLDVALLAIFVAQITVSTIVQFVFPRGPASSGWRLWGGSYEKWQMVQYATLCVFTVGILIHVMLHWSWVCSVIASRWKKGSRIDDGLQTIYGVGFMIAVLHVVGAVVAIAALSIRKT